MTSALTEGFLNAVKYEVEAEGHPTWVAEAAVKSLLTAFANGQWDGSIAALETIAEELSSID